MMQTNLHSRLNLQQLRDLSRGYARFARSAAGLGSVVGGVLVMVMWLASNLLELPLWSRLVLALFPVAWIVFKEVFRHRYYLRHGLACSRWSSEERGWHIAFTAFTAVVSVSVIWTVAPGLYAEAVLDWPMVGYVAIVAAMPVAVWLYMRTTEEFLVGVLLFCQAAVIVAGGHYPMALWTLFFPLFALFAIVAGIKQHLDYRRLDRRLRAAARQP